MSNMDVDMFVRRTNWLMKRLGEMEGGCYRFSIAGYAVAVVKSTTMPFFWMPMGTKILFRSRVDKCSCDMF